MGGFTTPPLTVPGIHLPSTTIGAFAIPGGPGYFNSSTAPSSGFFNSGAGGNSGFGNNGSGLSGWFNTNGRAVGRLGLSELRRAILGLFQPWQRRLRLRQQGHPAVLGSQRRFRLCQYRHQPGGFLPRHHVLTLAGKRPTPLACQAADPLAATIFSSGCAMGARRPDRSRGSRSCSRPRPWASS